MRRLTGRSVQRQQSKQAYSGGMLYLSRPLFNLTRTCSFFVQCVFDGHDSARWLRLVVAFFFFFVLQYGALPTNYPDPDITFSLCNNRLSTVS